jgi:hypothetical protein
MSWKTKLDYDYGFHQVFDDGVWYVICAFTGEKYRVTGCGRICAFFFEEELVGHAKSKAEKIMELFDESES